MNHDTVCCKNNAFDSRVHGHVYTAELQHAYSFIHVSSPSWWSASTTNLAAFNNLATCTSQPEASNRPNQLELEAKDGSLHAFQDKRERKGDRPTSIKHLNEFILHALPSTSLLRDVCIAPGASILLYSTFHCG